jgi:hypothetical protein
MGFPRVSGTPAFAQYLFLAPLYLVWVTGPAMLPRRRPRHSQNHTRAEAQRRQGRSGQKHRPIAETARQGIRAVGVKLYPFAPQRLERVKRTGERRSVGLSTKGQSLSSLQLDFSWLPGFLRAGLRARSMVSYPPETTKSFIPQEIPSSCHCIPVAVMLSYNLAE